MKFSREFEVRWSDCDPNRHLRGSALADYATHVRFKYLESRGFSMEEFAKQDLGPAVQKDETRYFREVLLGQTLAIDVTLGGLSPDGARWRLRHEFVRGDGVLAARLTLSGGWISLARRKLVAPPEALAEAFRALDRAEDFETLRSLDDRSPRDPE